MRLKNVAEQTAHALGIGRFLRYRNRARVRILMYHRFPGTPDEVRERLTAQCEHLRRNYKVIGLDEVARVASENRRLPSNSVAITIDDGYRDFEHAFPVFQKFGFKVTLYVVSGFAAGELWLWADQLLDLVERSPLNEVSIAMPGSVSRFSMADRSAVFNEVAQAMIRMPDQERLKLLKSLPALLETEMPRTVPERFAALSWTELRAMAGGGLDIGAHTVTHPILSKLESGAALKQEIAGSKRQIESAIGAPVNHFCYPNGKLPDVNDAALAVTESAGYQTAVLAESGLESPPFPLYRLKRVGVDPDYTPHYFERCVAGYRL